MAQPPPLPSSVKNRRLAHWLDLALPGAGLYYLGYRRLGAALAIPFLGCFFAALVLFLVAYGRYLSMVTSDNLMEAGRLESFGDLFPTASLIGLACVGGILQVCSMVLLRRAKRADAASTPPPPPEAKT